MSTRVQWRRGTTAQTAVFTGAVGEITVDTDKNVVVVHDGVTTGGYPAPTISLTQGAFNEANLAADLAQSAYNAANAAGSSSYSTAAFAHANGAFDEANSAYSLAQGAYNSANNVAPQIQPSYDHANAAYNQANVGTALAQSAFNEANTAYNAASDAYNFSTGISIHANASYDQANTTQTYAAAGYGQANNATTLAQAAYNSGNNTTTYAQAAYAQANTDATNISNVYTYAQAGYAKANNSGVVAQAAYDQANTNAGAITITQGIDDTQNTNISNLTTYSQSGFGLANATTTYVQAAYGQANTNAGAITVIQGVNLAQNTNITNVNAFAQAAYGQANTNAGAITITQGVDATQNTNITAADAKAQAAYNKANTGGTLTGATHITDITQSTTDTNGALIVDGGVGIAKNLNVGGDAIITGTLTVVGGTITTSSSTVTYANPYLTLHDPASNTWISSNDGVDIGIEYEYYDPVGASYVVLGGSGNGTTATLNISDRFVTPVGEVINISGVTPSGFNGSFVVTASSIGTVSFLNTTNASVTTTGALGKAQRTTQFSINSGTWATNTANVAFTLGSPNVTLPTGKYVTVTGCTPDKYNGTYLITSSGPGWIKYTVGGPDPHAITVAGQITLENRHAFTGWSNDSGYFEYYKSGNFDSTGSFGGLYGGIKAGSIIASPPQSISAADLTAGGFIQVPTTTVYDSSTPASNTLAQVASVMSLGQITVAAINTAVTYTNSATLYIAGPPVAGNNVTMAGNTYSLEVASGKSWFGGDVEFHTANGITFYDSTKQSTAAAPYTYSNASYAQANTGTILAQSAYNASNGASSFANTTFATSAYATAGYNQANSAYNFGNTTLTYAQAGFSKANNSVQSISGTSGSIVAIASGNTYNINLATTTVTTGTYGGSTNIPVITFDSFGRATSASNVAVSTTINLAGTTGTGSVAGGDTLTFTGNTGISTYSTGSTIYINNIGVTSFGGQTGAITLSSANVTTALGFTPANKAGDNFTGNVIVPNLTANTGVTINTSSYFTSTVLVTNATTANQIADLFATSTYRSAKYQIQMTSGTSYHTIELLMIHDGTSVWMNQYGEIFTGSSLGTFDANISGGNVQLLFTPTNAVTTVKLIRINIVV